MSENRHNFGPASPTESIVYGAMIPGYSLEYVDEWIGFMKNKSIQRICCLLTKNELDNYSVGLIRLYQAAFGEENVCQTPIEDYHLASIDLLAMNIFPFLSKSDQFQQKVVVHCNGGSGRTGHVLAAWLVYGRGQSIELATRPMNNSGITRNPREAVDNIRITDADFNRLFEEIVILRNQHQKNR